MSVGRAYEAVRPKLLRRLLDQRASIDPVLGRLDEPSARAQIEAVLDHIGNFLATGDQGHHRAFLHTFLAMRTAEAQPPGQVLAVLVAIGDTAAQVAHEDSAAHPDGAQLTLLLTRVTAATARGLNELIADELTRRLEQRARLAKQVPDRDVDRNRS